MSRLLFAMFQGGGNLALILPIVKKAVERGHSVRVLAGPAIWGSRAPVSASFRDRIAAAGATYVPFTQPEVHPLDQPPRPVGFLLGWTPKAVARGTWYVAAYRWAPAWSSNTWAELNKEDADVVAADFLLPGALVAGEAAGVPAVSLVHGIYKHRPAPGIPPFGCGFLPARGPLGRLRDAFWAAGIQRVYHRDALPFLNRARWQLRLPALRCMYDQFDRAARVLVLASQAFDLRAEALPANVRYLGAPADDVGAPPWRSPWSEAESRPVVLVSLSTLPQGQGPVLERILLALADMPIRAVVTLGPSLDRNSFVAPANVWLERFVPHAAVLPQVSAMVTQCGIGSVMKALVHGVPLVCMPLLGDQPDNAARVVAHGAGVRIGSNASPAQIRRAVERILADPSFRASASQLATQLRTQVDAAETAVRELEATAAERQTTQITVLQGARGGAPPFRRWHSRDLRLNSLRLSPVNLADRTPP
jgi:UDP:flavonoid glycosyltransferase YjiC (YdhE family)